MAPSIQSNIDRLRETFAAVGQDHILSFWGDLDPTARERLGAQAARIAPDLESLVAAHRAAVAGDDSLGEIEPAADAIALPEHGGDEARRRRAVTRGESLLADGRVGIFVVAGGQGTRLGFDGPKGSFPVGPVSDRCLFEIQAQKIRGIGRRYGNRVPWYVMTSDATDADTRALFEQRDYFGMPPEDVFIFPQGMVPAFDFEGRLMLETPDRIFESPNGHGGAITALSDSGALKDMRTRGIDTIFYYQVDNPLVRIADPEYLGLHDESRAEMSCKVLRKPDPDVKWGVVARVDGRVGIVEYTELTNDMRNARDTDGQLVYWAGSPAIHILSSDFVQRVSERADELLPYHASPKKIPTVAADGTPVSPSEPNGSKLERFVFDALPAAERVCIVETRQSEEFSPIKNAAGAESPETARRDLVAEYRRWLGSAGVDLPPEGRPIEIDHSHIDGPEDAAAAGLTSLDDADARVVIGSGSEA